MEITCPQCGRALHYVGEPPTFCGYCGKPLAVPPPATAAFTRSADTAPHGDKAGEVPGAVGGYRLLRPLGAGGMGKVYEAEERATGQRVALKLIAAEQAASPDAVERFRQEGRLASAIAHPRCVFVLAADEDAGRPYIVMELMPGSTLKDLVDRRGPLPPDEAVGRILDVIEGLQEAHALGVVHRDVKPSNCFVDADGRVKVGDFGLSKSLVSSAHLTRTGSFLGTPLYASPEQIRCEVVDQQTDVYSVAATLYYLLTGRAPFEGGDAAATMARIVTDPPPPVRALRPDVPRALERVVRRGLERQRERRWRGLGDMRAALLPLAPGRLSIGGLGVRFGAYVLDWLLLAVVGVTVNLLLALALAYSGRGTPTTLVGPALWLLYFGVLEGLWGCSLGKWLLRLRVCPTKAYRPPGVERALPRALAFYLLDHPGSIFFFLVITFPGVFGEQSSAMMLGLWLFYPLEALGVGLMVCTMRARNGYRGLHEFLSGTRVVCLPGPERRPRVPVRREPEAAPAAGLPGRLGPFMVRGVLRADGEERVLLGEDAVLGRRALLWLRPPGAPPLAPERPGVKRRTRLRWLTGGKDAAGGWDAFCAPTGCSLADFSAAAGPLPWAEARPLLEQLTDELAAASADGTLPRGLSLAHLWVQAEGHLLLLDTPLTAGPPGDGQLPTEVADEALCLDLLRRTALLLLEGRPRPAGDTPRVCAPLPLHAADLLSRLLSATPAPATVGRFQQDLAATSDRPVEVTRPRRGAHLALLTVLLAGGLFFAMLPAAVWPGALVVFEQIASFRKTERALRALEAESVRDVTAAALSASPPLLLAAAERFGQDAELRARLGQRAERVRRAREADFQSLGALAKTYATVMAAAPADKATGGEAGVSDVRKAARDLLAQPEGSTRDLQETYPFPLIMLATWPVIWVVWAFLARGALSFRVLGLALVRRDGRKAARWQCAWRALLVWTPVTLLLGASTVLEIAYWWDPGGRAAREAEMLSLSSALWWSAAGLLVAYVVLAVWLPRRSLHDRLAGTYLVPR